MTKEQVYQAIMIELSNILADGWKAHETEEEIVVRGPDSEDFLLEVWRIAQFVAYDEYVCIERESSAERAYKITSHSGTKLAFQIRVQAKE